MKPNGTKRQKMSVSHGSDDHFKPGNIISLRVWNFTTYSYGEFRLSPTLNMIIGPNGTGKSTFVAAVCLGLGGKIDLIKRKTMDLMIKSGEKESSIEITLKNRPGKDNLVIERSFFLRLSRSSWKVDGVASDVNIVRAIVKDFNIQLDNLCHFLPQERVAEFASLSPEKLLLETERTVGDNTLLEKHELLIELDGQWLDLTKTLENLEENITGLEADVQKFEQEARKFQEYEDKSREIVLHKKLLPYAKLQDVKEQMKSLKAVRDSAKKALQEFSAGAKPLEINLKMCKEDMKLLGEEISVLNDRIRQMNSRCEKAGTQATKLQQEIEETKNEIASLISRLKNLKVELESTILEKEDMETKLQNLDPIDEQDVERLSAERQERHEEKVRIEEEYDATKFEINALKRDTDVSENRFRDERRKLEDNDRLEILNTQGSKFRRDILNATYKAHLFLRKNRKELGLNYYEAPVVSCRVTDRRFAKFFENIVDKNSLISLFFDNESDYRKVSAALPKELNVPMRVVPSSVPAPPMSVETLKKLGFDGYLADFITGPETVIRGLKNRSFIHFVPVATKPISPELLKTCLEPKSRAETPFKKFIIESSVYIVNRSKYGSKQVFYQTEHIGEAHLMGSEGLSEEVKRDIQQRLKTLKTRLEEMKQELSTLEDKKKQHQDKLMAIDEDLKKLDVERRVWRKRKEARLKLEDTIRHTEARIKQLSESTAHDYSEKIEKAEKVLLGKYIELSQNFSESSVSNSEIVNMTIEQKKKFLLRQQLENKAIAFETLLLELDQRKVDLQERYAEAKSKYDEYKKGDAAREIRQQNLSPEDREVVRQLAEQYLSENKLTEKAVLHKIEQLGDDLSVLSNVDSGSMELLKTKRADLELAQRLLPEFTRKKEDLEERIKKISGPWERELDEMVNQISAAFQKNFITVASDGQVQIVKGERYKSWKLEILVKFRENSELKVLDHQLQSGGERAVSTIFFIMSLQGLTNAPIRIVDEINQGMDPKNEKLAHKYLVHTACKPGLAQYFLVTPKLLTGLYYHPGMTIHCIFTGPLLKKNNGTLGSSKFLDLQKNSYADV